MSCSNIPQQLVPTHKSHCPGAGFAMDAACNSLRQVAAGLQQCLEEEAPREKKYVLLLKGLACIAELKNQNQRLCEETERVRLCFFDLYTLHGFTSDLEQSKHGMLLSAPFVLHYSSQQALTACRCKPPQLKPRRSMTLRSFRCKTCCTRKGTTSRRSGPAGLSSEQASRQPAHSS